jgi:hypothetical protein
LQSWQSRGRQCLIKLLAGITRGTQGAAKKIIEDWHPAKCENEKDLETSLYNELHIRLPGVRFKQYGSGRPDYSVSTINRNQEI